MSEPNRDFYIQGGHDASYTSYCEHKTHYYYLRGKGGYVFSSVGWSSCLSVCLSILMYV